MIIIHDDIDRRIGSLGIKKTFIALQLGVSKSYISDLICGRIKSFENMQKLRKLLDVYEEELEKSGLLIK